jgi:outer membrane protein assembly factor BamB
MKLSSLRPVLFVAVPVAVAAGLAVHLLHGALPPKPTAPSSADWPQFRGPNNGDAPALAVANPNKIQIKELWKVPTPDGFSSFAVSGKQAFTIVDREIDGNKSETLIALDITNGKEEWAKPLGICTHKGGGDSGTQDNRGGDGPRSTPTVSEGKVYVTDSNLLVHCFDAKEGKEVWKHDVVKENNGKNITWDNAASPIVDGGLVLLCGGGKGQALLGLDKLTGAVKWKGEDDGMTHATPIVADVLGTHQCIFFTQSGLVSVEPQSGKVLWRAAFPWQTSTAASPVVYEDIVYCSAGYGVGAGAFKIAKNGSTFTATELWRRKNECFNHWSTPVVKDGYLYGMFSFKEYGKGPLCCVDIKTGKDMWKQPGFGAGQVILSGDIVVAMSDKGEVVFVKTNSASYEELKREQIISGKVWSYPVLAYNHLFARSTKEGGCWELK